MKKRADGRYCKQIFVGFKPDGKRKMKTVYGKTIKEIEKKEREFRNQIDCGIDVASSDADISLREWAIDWLDTYKLNNVEHNTYEMYRNSIYKHIIPQLGDILIKNLKTIHIQKLINSIISRGNIRTAEICKLTLKQIIKQALYNRIIAYDISVGIHTIKKDRKEKMPLTDFEKLAIEKASLTSKQRIFINIMRYTGLRKGEALALTVNDIDFEKMKLTVNKNLAFVGNNFQVKSTKTVNSNRMVPIPQFFKHDLHNYISELETDKLFTARNGDYMTKSAFRKFWNGTMKAVTLFGEEIKKVDETYSDCEITFTPHICRHTYATDIYYAGVDVKTAQYLLGHSSINITLEIYTHLDKFKIDDSAEKINNYISQSKVSQSAKMGISDGKQKVSKPHKHSVLDVF